MSRRITLFAAVLLLVAMPARSATVHDEALHGDLSGERLDPTVHTLQVGTNSLFAATGPGDLEYFSLTVPSGTTLERVILTQFDGESFVSFLAVQRGSTFTIAPAAATTADGMLGWTHLSNVGSDLLAAMGASTFGAEGFTPPLLAGSYTFWLQELDAPVTFQLDFHVSAVPEPTAWLMLACGLGLVAVGRNWRCRHPAGVN